MEKGNVKFAMTGEPGLLVMEVPGEIVPENVVHACLAIPLRQRSGGMLIAVPIDALDSDALVDEMSGAGDGILGPSKSFSSELLVETETGGIVLAGKRCRFYVVDFSDEILAYLRDYDPGRDPEEAIMPFDQEFPLGLPKVEGLDEQIIAWVTSQEVGRANFYSAREEPLSPAEGVPEAATPPPKKAGARKPTNAMLAEQIELLRAQMASLADAQAAPQTPPHRTAARAQEPAASGVFGLGASAKVPAVISTIGGGGLLGTPLLASVAEAAKMVGPLPKVKAVPPFPGRQTQAVAELPQQDPSNWMNSSGPADPVLQAIAQQSTALTALVAHLASSSDPLADLGHSGAASSSTTRGVQRRERPQSELASGSSAFFLTVAQQMHRRMFPSRPVPKTESDIKGSGISLLAYLERFGGFKHQKEIGLCLWILGHSFDAMLQDNMDLAKEHLALLLVAMEQSALDQGDWTLAFLLSLSEEPPVQLFQDRMVSMHGQSRPFSPLVPSSWSAVCLSYLKEMEVLNTKKAETIPRAKAPAAPVNPADPVASPKRKTRYPKKPKAAEE